MELYIYILIFILNLGLIGFILGYAFYKINKEEQNRKRLERFMKTDKGKRQWLGK